MFLGQEFKIFDWFIIHFTENNGMAFGLEFGGDTGKILLSLFRIVVVIWGVYYVNQLTKNKLPNGALTSLGLVIGGAIGNIIDRIYLGEVVDFFDVGLGSYRWPIFNFADSFVTVGVFVLIFIHSSGDKQDLRDSD